MLTSAARSLALCFHPCWCPLPHAEGGAQRPGPGSPDRALVWSASGVGLADSNSEEGDFSDSGSVVGDLPLGQMAGSGVGARGGSAGGKGAGSGGSVVGRSATSGGRTDSMRFFRWVVLKGQVEGAM